MKAIYQFHPDFADAGIQVWWATPSGTGARPPSRAATSCPWGNGVVLVGMSERTSRQAITQVAKAPFDHEAAERVVVAGMPARAAMHLDTVFTFADRTSSPPTPPSWTASRPSRSAP